MRALIAAVLFAGCAVSQADLDAWRNQPIAKLIERWGIPDQQIDLGDGSKAWVFVRTGGSVSIPRKNYSTGQITSVLNLPPAVCRNIFIVRENRIERYQAEGRCRTGPKP